MKRLDVNEKAFALLLNVTPMTIRLWTSGAVRPCGTSRRLMQIYGICPEAVSSIAGEAGKDKEGK
jgi:putative transcriptional regulator